MGNRLDTQIVLGSLRYKSAPNTDIGLKVPFEQTEKEIFEFDRNINVDLAQVFDDERQKSDIFRPTCKFSIIFKNSYTGTTNYTPFENNLYYINTSAAAKAQCENGLSVAWSGFPQYNEFDFIRNDYGISGYTQPPNNHLNFVSKSASTYNWGFYMSYAYDNLYTKQMESIDSKTSQLLSWNVSEGIPFIVENITSNGKKIVSFRSPLKHGLSVGDAVNLSLSYNNISNFQVFSLGVGTTGSDEYVFNLLNVGYTGSTFNNGVKGTAKRIINILHSADTISQYYVRRHKIISNSDDAVLVKSGFEQNIFGKNKKFESSGFTPNNVERVSVKEGSQSYTLSFSKDFEINPIRDNHSRPISELFFTAVWRGYFGWMFGLPNGSGGFYGLKQGYGFNLPLNPSTKQPTSWWSNSNNNSDTNFPMGSYTNPLGVKPSGSLIDFTYVKPLNDGDIIEGDICEWNDYEQKERVVSNLYHKLKFNPFVFKIGGNNNNPLGYYYQPHHSLTIREYSDYIEEGDKKNVVGIPDYSHFSTTKNSFIWRDLYPYGYIDSDNIGVNYPFLNGTHYPYTNIIFRIIPEGTNYIEQILVTDPTIDECE
jgi:hypothetical protein